MNTTQKAIVAPVPFGTIEIEGLMLEDQSFAVAVPQVTCMFLDTHQHPAQFLKRLLSKSNVTHINKAKTKFNQKPVNILTLDQFEIVVIALAKSGNKKAIEFVTDLFGLSLYQMFCDAFGLKFEQEARQEFLEQRQLHKKQYHELFTKWGKYDGFKYDWEYGQRMNEVKSYLHLPKIYVGDYTLDELRKLNQAEIRYDVLRTAGMNHYTAMSLVVSYLR